MDVRKVVVRGRVKTPVFEVVRRFGNSCHEGGIFPTYAKAKRFVDESIERYSLHRFEIREVLRMEVFHADRVTRLPASQARKIDELITRGWDMEKKEVRTRRRRMC